MCSALTLRHRGIINSEVLEILLKRDKTAFEVFAGMKIAVTGCNGLVGRHVVVHCLNEGHAVVGIDHSDPILDEIAVRRAEEHEAYSFVKVDLRDYDEVVRVLKGCDAIEVTFLLQQLGINRIAQASTCNVVQGVYSKNGPNPKYFPIDEDHPCEPDEPYGLSKLIAEMQAECIVRRWPDVRIASLRLHWALPSRLHAVRENPETRRADLWGWVHVDAVANAFLLALTAEEGRWKGHEAFFIAAPDLADEHSSAELLERFFPNVPLKEGKKLEGRASLVCSDKAQRVLGWVHKVPDEGEEFT
ncbi:NAD-binding protein [Sanghuangporus baumii]|uniref:NAD-binding protein n=1 Tax=Sanghuangporus baumii TaxID=108892 RepID=A0A9Q5I4P4_SANBA|nr:NAD-binding protein [Sanghuangporus baumii]